MPSSMIFVGLVVMWLLILVPAVARRRQEVARPSVTALSGRVLERTPRRGPDRAPAAGRDVEVDVKHEQEPAHAVATRTDTERRPRRPAQPVEPDPGPHGRTPDDLDGWTWRDLDGDAEDGGQRGPDPGRAPTASSRYRPGRGGYDPEAAAIAARARCAFRQRLVLLLFILAVGSALAAVFTLPALWWTHGALDIGLVGYLVYLRRQVRVEEAIRKRRSARVGASRRAPEIESDGPRRERPDRPRRAEEVPSPREPVDGPDLDQAASDDDAEDHGSRAEQDVPVTAAATTAPDPVEAAEPERPALPRLKPIPIPPVPIGMTLVDGEEDDPALHELESVARPDYRRASGQ